jgi:dynein heavy chain 1
MAEGPLLSVNGNGLLEPPTTVNPEPILQYLIDVLKPFLGTSESDLTAPDSLLHPSRLQDTLSRCARFAQEAQVAVLYIQKIEAPILDSLDIDEDGGTNGSSRMSLVLTFSYLPLLMRIQRRLHDAPT